MLRRALSRSARRPGRAVPARAPTPASSTRAVKQGDVVDDYHGTKVKDPYRWLEDLGSAETKAFIEAQNALSSSRRSRPSPPARGHPEAPHRPLELPAHRPCPCARGASSSIGKNSGLEKQAPLFVRDSARRASPRLLLDPNALSPDGSVAFAQSQPSPDGRYLAYGLAAGRRRLAGRARARGRHRPRPRRPDRLVPLLRDLLDEGQQGLLLLALPRAPEGPGAAGRPRAPEALLPPRGHAPGPGPAHLRAAGPARSGSWAAGATEDGRYLDRLSPERHGSQEPPLLRRPRRSPEPAPRRPHRRRSSTRTSPSSSVLGNRGSRLFVRTDLEAPKRKVIVIDPRLRIGPGRLEDRDSRARAAPRGRGLRRGQALRPVPGRREERGRDVLRGRARARASWPCPGWARSRASRAGRTATSSSTRSPPSSAPPPSTATTSKTRATAAFEPPPAVFDPAGYETTPGLLHLEGRHARAHVPDREEGLAPRRLGPGVALRLRRLRDQRAALVPALGARLARDGRGLRGARPPRRRRVRRGVAPRGHEGEEAERLRRLHRRRRVPGPREVHLARRGSPSRAARTAACSWARS